MRLIAILLLITPLLGISQIRDTSEIPQDSIQKFKYFLSYNQLNLIPDTQQIKTPHSLKLFHRYSSIKNIPAVPAGLSGQKYFNLLFTPQPKQPGVNFTSFPFYHYFPSSFDSIFLNRGPSLTQLNLLIGSGGEQIVKVLHVQNIKKVVSLFIEGQKIYNDGLYPNQIGDYGIGKAGAAFNQHGFHLSASHQFLNVIMGENGGIQDSVDLNFYSGTQMGSLPVNLNTAENRYRSRSTRFSAGYNLLHSSDSIPSKIFLRPTISFDLNRQQQIYRDNFSSSGFYSHHYLDSAGSMDSTFFKARNATIALEGGSKRFSAGIKFYRQLFDYHIQVPSLGYFNDLAGAAFSIKPDSITSLRAEADFVINGFNKSDFSSRVQIKRKLGPVLASAWVALSRQLPHLTDFRYFSNHFIWDKSLGQETVSQASVAVEVPTMRVRSSLTYTLLTDPVRADTSFIPLQYSGSHGHLNFTLRKELNYRKLHFIPEIYLQNSSSDVIQVPALSGRLNVYLETYIFNNALLVQPGADLLIHSEYKPYGYQPATRTLFVQDQFSSKPFPYLDVYVSFRVKTLRAFVMFENLLTGWAGYHYIPSPGYPAVTRNLKVGLSWNFFN